MRQRTAAVAVVLALAMGLTAACGGEGGDGDNAADKPKQSKETAAATPTGAPPVSPTGSAPRTGPRRELTKPELEKAILAEGDVAGFSVGSLGSPPPEGEKADTPQCAPLTAVISGKPEPAARASAYRRLVGAEEGTAVSEFLTSHGAQGAVAVVSRLRAAVRDCEDGFTANGSEGPSTYRSVKALPVAQAGDESFAYQVTGDFEGDAVPLVFQVVRSGGTLAIFYTANFTGPQTPKIPPALLTAQVAKLK
ncbi:hypothetical protein OG883_04035 [Streptomyces sp. NBC_01142]|uniref:hypothetical protein n=1 Tax=Streptomyces sp. NBC_01142 TaxID=2975865 RepID=UPI00225BAD1F|nr:hypothetical protein [Streptomyces sp. NBC_01142]MCX4819086.1 hypothetical protein [Streptomyces sp. NBC_01142]